MSNALNALLLLTFGIVATSCGDDAEEELRNRNRDTAWIDTTDPLTGTRLSCFYVDGSNSATMHCIEVAP